MNSNQIIEHFRKISNTPCWNVEKGTGSFLTFEFGKPLIEFTKPKIWEQLKYPLNQNKIRRVFLKGSEKLWIYCCNWRIHNGGLEIAHNESEDWQIHDGTRVLNGQILQQIIIDLKNVETKFVFDLGGKLTTYNETYEKTDEAWMLYLEDVVLTMNNNGNFNLCNSNHVRTSKDFVKINQEQVEITLHNNA